MPSPSPAAGSAGEIGVSTGSAKAQNPALQLAFFDIAAGGHLTTIPLFDAGLVSHGQVIEKQGRFYVSAVKDGDAVLTVGDRLP